VELFFNIEGSYFPISLFLIGLISGFVGAMGGPSGLVILPFMIMSGFSPVLALGTARFAATMPWVIAVTKFKKAGQVRIPEIFYLAILGGVAGTIGTYLILDIDESYVYPIIGVALMIAAPLSFVKKDFGLINKDYGRVKGAFGYFIYFIVMLYGGFFGAGASVLAIFTIVSFMGFKMLEAHSTHMAVWIIMSVASCALFMINGQIDYYNALIILISMSIGSYIGSKVIIQQGDRWIKIIICAFAFVVGVKLVAQNL
jgi:uncharacterized membrane protein YfcA